MQAVAVSMRRLRFLSGERCARAFAAIAIAGMCLASAACGTDGDPCAAVTTTCVTLHVRSATVARIDHLELDLLYADRHATTTVDGAGVVSLPVSSAIELDLAGPLTVSIVAAGKLGGQVLGIGSGKVMVAEGAHAELAFSLVPPPTCVSGAFYCGGDKIIGDPLTLYQCNAGGAPRARGMCPGACVVRMGQDDECAAVGATCVDGGTYCGGDGLSGDPSTLYRCAGGAGTLVMHCANGCVVNPSPFRDACR